LKAFFYKQSWNLWSAALLSGVVFSSQSLFAQTVSASTQNTAVQIVEAQGLVEIEPNSGTIWSPCQTNQTLHPFDRLRTGSNSRVALRWSDQSIVTFGSSAELEVLPPNSTDAQCGLHLVRGIISFFHRDQPGKIQIITRGAVAGVEGTEFALNTTDAGDTTLSVMDGKVRFGNEQATLLLTNGQQAVAAPGKAPTRTAGFIANNLLQWCFYYPAILDLQDLRLSSEETKALAASLDAYRAGDLPNALKNYPATRTSVSSEEQIYHAAVLLAAGQVTSTETILTDLSAQKLDERGQRLIAALHQLIAAVKYQSVPKTQPRLATEFLAASYYEQSRAQRDASLKNALAMAKDATSLSPQSGFAWARLAELELSFGHVAEANDALTKSLAFAPRNAQALALKGFISLQRNETKDAIAWFNRALAVDSSLGNAWLGRGLGRIRRGDANGGREDLLVAAALEPQRSELRSYLGKAYANNHDFQRATNEWNLAKKLDPQDPTPWLYSALLNQQGNHVNDAIHDLEKSESLNGNRSVYRSQLLLDQDQAVRSANLASMYQDAGMDDVSLNEAGRAVNYDYANYSAHLFLANSYNQLNDTKDVNFRYETPMNNEYLLANLLAPTSAGVISPAISQQPYSKLFNGDNRIGVSSDTEYLSRGAWTQSGAAFGTFDNFSYGVEGYYNYDPGQHNNNDYEARYLSITLKQQFTPQDSGYVQIQSAELDGGDPHQYYYPESANQTFRFKESQEPNVIVGYNHEWSPGVHTLFLAARLDDHYSYTTFNNPFILTARDGVTPGEGEVFASEHADGMTTSFENQMTIYSGELQQIWETPEHNTIIGARIQYGDVDTSDYLVYNFSVPDWLAYFPFPPAPAADQDFNSYFNRYSVYAYHQWQIWEPLQIVAGLTYDWLQYPENASTIPVADNEATTDQLSPKAGLIWTPLKDTVVRFAYTRSLGGMSLDQSWQLEPSQIAGFIQSFRSIIPTDVVGEAPGAHFESYGLSVEQKFPTGTYLALYGGILNSQLYRTIGAFDVLDFPFYATPSGFQENLDYQEKTLQFTVNQLIGHDWAAGAQYRISQARLDDNYPEATPPMDPTSVLAHQRTKAVLQQTRFFALFNHPSGFFAEGEALWNAQDNQDAASDLPDDHFWQFNAYAGWRFFQRRAEITLGLLNIGNQGYNLNPLNLHDELPQRRTLMARLRINF